ncbi:fam-l protein [Plasmodium malariae]|uniref:Fam-l protein n=1 Tax=Plasmodium malariae TaxID=5858 RepID=A0A1D3JHW4_PLAMA|nr:fam-l protein [Plasmodium malariae]SBT85849.1 fam-l protein [Plasmodium malariae]
MKILFIIKIYTFILLKGIYHIYNYMVINFNKSMDKYYNLDINVDTKICRLLAKCEQIKDSYVAGLKQKIPNYGENEKYNISNYEKTLKVKNKQSNGSSSKSTRRQNQAIKNKSCMFETKKYSRLEKKIFKELDYFDFLKNNKNISDKLYKKIIRKKCGLRIALPLLLFLFLSISLIFDLFCGYGLIGNLFVVLKMFSLTKWMNPFNKWLFASPFSWMGVKKIKVTVGRVTSYKSSIISSFFSFLIYFLPLFILGVTKCSSDILLSYKSKKI